MTKKKLTDNLKNDLVNDWKTSSYTVGELQKKYEVSGRSINRVLEEFGVPTYEERVRTGLRVLDRMNKYGFSIIEVEKMMKAANTNTRYIPPAKTDSTVAIEVLKQSNQPKSLNQVKDLSSDSSKP